jgi:hypothetical protein
MPQFELPIEFAEETLQVRRLKEMLANAPRDRGDRLCCTFKMTRERHGRFLAAAYKHGMTATDLFTLFVDQITPVLLKATPLEVPGYRRDLRTKLPRSRRGGN